MQRHVFLQSPYSQHHSQFSPDFSSLLWPVLPQFLASHLLSRSWLASVLTINIQDQQLEILPESLLRTSSSRIRSLTLRNFNFDFFAELLIAILMTSQPFDHNAKCYWATIVPSALSEIEPFLHLKSDKIWNLTSWHCFNEFTVEMNSTSLSQFPGKIGGSQWTHLKFPIS